MTTRRKLSYGIAIPQVFPDGEIDTSFISHFVSKAESLGYDSLWVQEQSIGKALMLDPILLLTYAASLTNRVKLASAVILTNLSNPIHWAKSLATLDQLSNGRLIVGIGLGMNSTNYPAFGISPERRVSRFEEGISLIKALWTQESVTFHGRFWQMENAYLNPKPLQKPHPPLWFGAQSAPALKRATRLGDGWIAQGSSSTAAFKENAKLLRQSLEQDGKDPLSFPIGKRVYIAVDKNKDTAAKTLQNWFAHRYGNPSRATEVSVYGNEQECIDGLSDILSVGIDVLQLNPIANEIEQAERLSKDILPKL